MTAQVSPHSNRAQEAADRFYLRNGPCCAGCDWWHHFNSSLGECRRSAPVSADERWSGVTMDRITYLTLPKDAGHIVTKRDHHCGEFKDTFDWLTLPPPYLRRIGWTNERGQG